MTTLLRLLVVAIFLSACQPVHVVDAVDIPDFATSAVASTPAPYAGELRRKVVGVNSTSMTIYPLGTFQLRSGGAWKTYTHIYPTVVSPTVLANGLAASTRYWIYAYDKGGSVDFIALATEPDVGLRYMDGNQGYLYVSTFATNPGFNLQPYVQTDNDYTLSTNQPILNRGRNTSFTPVPFGVAIPKQATRIAYSVNIDPVSPGYWADLVEGGYIQTRVKDDGVSPSYAQGFMNVSPSGGAMYYRVSNAALQLTILPLGFRL